MKKHSRLNVHFTILYYLGFWTSDPAEPPSFSKTWRFICPRFFIVRLAYGPFFHVFGLRLRWDNPIDRTEEIILIMMWSFMFIKFAGLFWQRERLARLFAELDYLEEADDDDESCTAIRWRCTLSTNKLTNAWLVTAFTSAVSLCLPMYWQAFATGSIPLRWWMPVDISPSPLFEIVAFFTITTGMFDVMSFSICDTLFNAITLHTAARLRVLRYKIENSHAMVRCAILKEATASLVGAQHGVEGKVGSVLGREQNVIASMNMIVHCGVAASLVLPPCVETPLLKEEFHRRTEAFLIKCVRTHYALIEFTGEIQKTFNVMLHCQIALNVSVAVMALYVTTVAEGFTSNVLICSVVCFFVALGFHALCSAGHTLTEESDLLRESAYSCEWPHASERFKRSLRLIMCRTLHPLRLHAAGFPLNFNTFRVATRVSYYLHKVLVNLVRGKKINIRS